jgi:hypothetical protein
LLTVTRADRTAGRVRAESPGTHQEARWEDTSTRRHRGGPTQTHPITGFAGEPPKRVNIQGWDSLDKLKGWRNDPEFVQLVKDVGEKHAKFRSYAVETQ